MDLSKARAVAAVSMAIASSTVAAQSASSSKPGVTDNSIVVEGRPLSGKAKIQALVRSISPRLSYDQPFARFKDPVCFATVGLPGPMLRSIGYRLAQDAQAAGVRLAGDGCNPNILVMFVDDSAAQLQTLLREAPELFSGLEPQELRAISDEPDPVRVWSISAIRSRDGNRLSAGEPPILKIDLATFIGLAIRRDMTSTIMLIDRSATLGFSVQQVADYAAMRTLAMIRPKPSLAGDTILTLFQPATLPPSGMTGFDRGYLKAWYAGTANERGSTKLTMIVRSIVKSEEAAK